MTPLCVVFALCLVVAAWLAGVRIPFASGTTWFTVTKVGAAHFSDEPSQPFFFLVVGSDSRPGVGGSRGDALHLIGVNPASHAATILDIPRDTGATIPGHGTDKINAALAYGGLALQAQTVSNLVGVKIPYAITTDFAGFTSMIDELGGVDVNVPSTMHDSYSGAFYGPGPHHFTGDESLRFVRDRHDFPTGDIKRTENQGIFMLSALATLEKRNLGAAGTLHDLAVAWRHTQLEGVGLVDLYRLGRLAQAIDPANVKNVTIPVGSGTGTRLQVEPSARALFADFADDGILETH